MKKDLKDHEYVEKAEVWWKSKTKMFQLVLGIIVGAVAYNVFFG